MNELWNTKQVCDYLNVSREYVRQLVEMGILIPDHVIHKEKVSYNVYKKSYIIEYKKNKEKIHQESSRQRLYNKTKELKDITYSHIRSMTGITYAEITVYCKKLGIKCGYDSKRRRLIFNINEAYIKLLQEIKNDKKD